jgi:hypothetical protein
MIFFFFFSLDLMISEINLIQFHVKLFFLVFSLDLMIYDIRLNSISDLLINF